MDEKNSKEDFSHTQELFDEASITDLGQDGQFISEMASQKFEKYKKIQEETLKEHYANYELISHVLTEKTKMLHELEETLRNSTKIIKFDENCFGELMECTKKTHEALQTYNERINLCENAVKQCNADFEMWETEKASVIKLLKEQKKLAKQRLQQSEEGLQAAQDEQKQMRTHYETVLTDLAKKNEKHQEVMNQKQKEEADLVKEVEFLKLECQRRKEKNQSLNMQLDIVNKQKEQLTFLENMQREEMSRHGAIRKEKIQKAQEANKNIKANKKKYEDECKEMEEKIKDHNDKISEIEKLNSELNQKNKESIVKLDGSRKKNERLKKEYSLLEQTKQEEENKFQCQLAENEAKKVDLEIKIDNIKQKLEYLREKNHGISENMKEKLLNIKDLNEKIESLKISLTAQNEEYEAERNKLELAVKDEEEQCGALDKTIENLQKQIEEVTNKNKELESELVPLVQEKLQMEIEGNLEYDTLREKENQLKADIENKKVYLKEFEERLSNELELSKKENEQKIQDLAERHKTTKENLEENHKKLLKKHHNQYEELKKKLKETELQVEQDKRMKKLIQEKVDQYLKILTQYRENKQPPIVTAPIGDDIVPAGVHHSSPIQAGNSSHQSCEIVGTLDDNIPDAPCSVSFDSTSTICGIDSQKLKAWKSKFQQEDRDNELLFNALKKSSVPCPSNESPKKRRSKRTKK